MDDYRVLCIVRNDYEDCENGLIKCFKKSNSEIIQSLLYKYSMDDNRKETMEIVLGADNHSKCIYFINNQNPTLGKVSASLKWDLLLVHDSVELDKYPDAWFNENTLVIYHTTPENTNAFLTKKKEAGKLKELKQGMHEYGDDKGYPRLLKVFESIENGVLNQKKYSTAHRSIINWFEIHDKLEAGLKFLHNCLDQRFDNIPRIFITEEVVLLYNSLKNIEVESEEFNKILCQLRDKILGVALQKSKD
jgi:hypothetical protein